MALSHVILERVLGLVPVVMSLTVHEWAHAWAATQLGDTTAKDRGRLTLNPIAHLDLVGTIALPLLGIPFGWAKPVPVEPSRFRAGVSMGGGMLLAALAGPLSNFVLALVCAAGLRLFASSGESLLGELLRRGLVVNVALALFNLLPVPPLDGSRVVDAFIPFEYRETWRRVGMAAGILLLVAVVALPMLGVGASLFAWIARLAR
jgi:Zn-dependent protease